MNTSDVKRRRVLWICYEWPTAAPDWWTPDLRIDLVCLREPSEEILSSISTECLKVERVIKLNGKTGFQTTADGLLQIEGSIGLRNEELRRMFRDLLSQDRWDASIIDGLGAAAPLLGDYGLEVPRELSWIIYRPRRSEVGAWNQVISKLPVHRSLMARVHRWRLAKIESSIFSRAARVLPSRDDQRVGTSVMFDRFAPVEDVAPRPK